MADSSKITKKQLNAAMTKVKAYADSLGVTGGSNITKVSELENDAGYVTKTEVDSQIKEIENNIQNIGNPTDEQIKNAIDEAIANGSIALGGLTEAQINALDAMFQKCVFNGDVSSQYETFKTAFGINTGTGGGGSETPAVTLSSISATYSGGDVTVGTVLTDLTGITVTATYSDQSTSIVTDYVLSGEISEGSNTITVTYNGKTTTFTVVGIVQTSDQGWTNGVPYTQPLIEGYRLSNGVVEEAAGSYVTDFLPCKGVTAISASTSVAGGRQALYDKDKNFIGVNYSSSPILIDRDAYYARFTPNNADCIFTPIAYPVYKEGMVWEANKYYSLSYIPKETVNANGAIGNSSWWRTEYMYCYGATSIKWRTSNYSSGNANNRCKLAFFDSEKVFIQTIESRLADTAFTEIPNNSAYVILTRSDEVGTDNGYIVFS